MVVPNGNGTIDALTDGLLTLRYLFGRTLVAMSYYLNLSSPGDQKLIPMMFWSYVFSGSTLALIIFYDPYWWAMLLFFVSGIFESFFNGSTQFNP